jgi:hypothetical protein
LLEIEVEDRHLVKLTSLVEASSSVEAFGYSLWAFSRILNFAREEYPGGIPGAFLMKELMFHPFFGEVPPRGRAQVVGWDDCLEITKSRLREAGSSSEAACNGTRPLYDFLEKLGQFQESVRQKDAWLAGRITTVAMELLEKKGAASRISYEELTRLGPKLALYARRLFQGESVESVVQDVPMHTASRIPSSGNRREGTDRGDWDGTWDNVHRLTEGE